MSQRASGILLHLTSLPNEYPIGDLGPAATSFVDFMAKSGQHLWQMLPIGPLGAENSPYESSSAFAGNPFLMSPDRLVERGFLTRHEIGSLVTSVVGKVDYSAASVLKRRVLRKAFDHFSEMKTRWNSELNTFVEKESFWLEDFALFSAIQESEGTSDWTRWKIELRTRQPAALARAQQDHADAIRYHQFVQWQFSAQWEQLRAYCASKHVQLIGDVPMFVSHQSADVWAHQELFKLNSSGNPTVVAGVPPDSFRKTGQLWELPVYRWDVLRAQNYRWWIERLRTAFGRFAVNRLDHFIGYVRTYEIPAQARTAIDGQYRPGAGSTFFNSVREALGSVSFIADDLGDTNSEVVSLLNQLQIPGDRVLQYEFDAELESNPHQAPHPLQTVVYTGTHDNDTTAGWYGKLSENQRATLDKKLGTNADDIVWAMIRAALASQAHIAIIPAQDLLKLGTEARMNLPGTPKGNWGWRLKDGALSGEIAQRLRQLTEEYRRQQTTERRPAA